MNRCHSFGMSVHYDYIYISFVRGVCLLNDGGGADPSTGGGDGVSSVLLRDPSNDIVQT